MLPRDLGDFQTPPELARAIVRRLGIDGATCASALEPTCGSGAFLQALRELPQPPRQLIGIELQARHAAAARSIAEPHGAGSMVYEQSVFDIDLRSLDFVGGRAGLVIGNPPWVTSAELGSLGSANLPARSNVHGLRGIEALTGSSNFDLAESVWITVLAAFAGTGTRYAMLCKTSVARRVLAWARRMGVPVADAAIFHIDARRWFGAAVDACLFTCTTPRGGWSCWEAAVHASLDAAVPSSTIGFSGSGELVGDVHAWRTVEHIDGESPLEWRQGIKHDAAAVMELRRSADGLVNGLGEPVDVEEQYVYPLAKGSDVYHGRVDGAARYVIVPQRTVGEDTAPLRSTAPRLWAYLTSKHERLAARRSSIYRGRPPFSIFGVGPYSFSPHKVVVSGLHKQPVFRALAPIDGAPVVCDDTCYLLPCESAAHAASVAAVLNGTEVQRFLRCISFADAKRPVTKRVLQRIDLAAVGRDAGSRHRAPDGAASRRGIARCAQAGSPGE